MQLSPSYGFVNYLLCDKCLNEKIITELNVSSKFIAE